MDSIIIPKETILQQEQVLISPFQNDISNQIQVIIPQNQDYNQQSISSKNIQFQIPTGSYAIDVRNSSFEYTPLLTYHFNISTVNTCKTAWFINGLWYEQTYTINPNGDEPPALSGDPVCVGTAPLTAMNILQRSEMTGLNSQDFDDYKYQQAIYYLLKNTSTKNLDTWFVSDNPYNPRTGEGDYIVFLMEGQETKKIWINATQLEPGISIDSNFSLGPKATYTTDYSVSVYKKFKIPLELLNSVFLQESSGLFLCNAVNTNNILLNLTTRSQDADKLFGTRCDDKAQIINGMTGTGLVYQKSLLQAGTDSRVSPLINSSNTYACYVEDCRLILQTKQSQEFTQALRSRERIVNKLQDYEIVNTLGGLSQNDVGAKNFQLTSSNNSIQDIMFFFSLQDEQAKDSTRIHGIPTLYSSSDIVTIMNSKTQDFITPFLYNLQIQINQNGQSQNLIMGDTGIKTIEMYKTITLQALRLWDNFQSSGNQLFQNNLWKLLMNLFIINVESLRNNDNLDNVSGDNLNMIGRPLQISWSGVVNYSNTTQAGNPRQIPVTSVPNILNGHIKFLTYETNSALTATTGADYMCMFITERWSILKPQENKLLLTTRIQEAVNRPLNIQ